MLTVPTNAPPAGQQIESLFDFKRPTRLEFRHIHPSLISGSIASDTTNFMVGVNMARRDVIYAPYIFEKPVSISNFAARKATTGTVSLRFALYKGNHPEWPGLPGTLLQDIGTKTISTSGTTTDLSYDFEPGIYWMATRTTATSTTSNAIYGILAAWPGASPFLSNIRPLTDDSGYQTSFKTTHAADDSPFTSDPVLTWEGGYAYSPYITLGLAL